MYKYLLGGLIVSGVMYYGISPPSKKPSDKLKDLQIIYKSTIPSKSDQEYIKYVEATGLSIYESLRKHFDYSVIEEEIN